MFIDSRIPMILRSYRSALEIGHFLEAQRHDAAASFQSPAKGDKIVAQGQRGAGAPSAALG